MRTKHRKKAQIQALVQSADLAAYAADLRPFVTELRALAEDATAPASERVHSRPFLRKDMLKKLREVEARIEAALDAAPETDPYPTGSCL